MAPIFDENAMSTPVPSIQTPAEHPGRCRRCNERIVLRCGLVGYLDASPYCAECLRRASPALGWALILLDEAGSLLNGRWPKKANGTELYLLLTIIRRLKAVFRKRTGERRPTPRQSLGQATELLAEQLAETRALLRQAAGQLESVEQDILKPIELGAGWTDSLTLPPDRD